MSASRRSSTRAKSVGAPGVLGAAGSGDRRGWWGCADALNRCRVRSATCGLPVGQVAPACGGLRPVALPTPLRSAVPLLSISDEPKTPYLSPMDTDEEGDLSGLQSLWYPGVQRPQQRWAERRRQREMLAVHSRACSAHAGESNPGFSTRLCRVPLLPITGSGMRPLSLEEAEQAVAAAAAADAAAAGPSASNGTTSDEAGSSGRLGRGRWVRTRCEVWARQSHVSLCLTAEAAAAGPMYSIRSPVSLPLPATPRRGRHVRIGGRGWSDSDLTVSPSPRHPEGGSPSRAARSPRFSDQIPGYYDDIEGHDDEEGACVMLRGVGGCMRGRRIRYLDATRGQGDEEVRAHGPSGVGGGGGAAVGI